MTSRRVIKHDICIFALRVGQGQAACFMVGGDHDQRVAFLLGIVESDLDGIVEVEHLVHHPGGVVAMAGKVDLRAFHHEEETVFSIIQGLQSRLHGTRQEVATFSRMRHVVGIGHDSVFLAGHIDVGEGVIDLPTEFVLHAFHKVDTVLALVEMLHATTNDKVQIRIFGHLHSNILILFAMRHLGIERGRCGMGDIARHHDAGLLALLLHHLKDRFHWNRVRIHTNHGVFCLVVAGKGCACCS